MKKLPKRAQRKIKLLHPSYQPSKAELEEPIEFPEGTKPDDLAKAIIQPVKVRYAEPKRRR